MQKEQAVADIGDDVMNGVAEIAAFIRQPVRRTYRLLETKQVPGWKWGNIWHGRKSTIRADIARREGAA